MFSTLLEHIRNWLRPAASLEDATSARIETDRIQPVSPLAFLVDDEEGICKLIAATLATMGVETEKFYTAQDAVAALDGRLPAIIFLDVALQRSDAVDVIRGLGEKG